MLQSSYRKFYSTKTLLLKVNNGIFLNMNSQRVTLLFLLDSSTAFIPLIMVSYLRGLGPHLEFVIQHCPGLHHT